MSSWKEHDFYDNNMLYIGRINELPIPTKLIYYIRIVKVVNVPNSYAFRLGVFTRFGFIVYANANEVIRVNIGYVIVVFDHM